MAVDPAQHPTICPIQQSLLRLFLSFTLAVACAWIIAWHPRRSSLMDPLSDLEERKTLILLGVVGAVVAELAGSSQTLAFVIFGIGALLRFRTVLDNPKLTGKAIMVVVVGLACGMGSWAMAIFVTAFSWLLIYWLDSHASCRIRIRLANNVNPQPVFGHGASVARTVADFTVPRSTRRKAKWCSSSTSRRESTQKNWRQRCELNWGNPPPQKSILT